MGCALPQEDQQIVDKQSHRSLHRPEQQSTMLVTNVVRVAAPATEEKLAKEQQQQQQQAGGKLKGTHSALVKLLESAPIAQIRPELKQKLNDFNGNSDQNHYRKGDLGTSKCPWKKSRICAEWVLKNQQEAEKGQQEAACEQGIAAAATVIPEETESMPKGDPQAALPGDEDVEMVDLEGLVCTCHEEEEEQQQQQQGQDDCMSGGQRRNSSDSTDDDELMKCGCSHCSKQASGAVMDPAASLVAQHRASSVSDSGCEDSDCAENKITDLCNRFNENLSKDDGFFRRSIQQKIQYRPCTKNQQCSILRINRNRCQYCRLKKCIAVGMSRDAVRFGRVPKREKARILAAMQQSTQNRGQQRALATELDDQPRLLAAVLRAHMETCEFTREKVTAMRQRARDCPSYSMPTLACPLNPAPELQSEQEFSQRFAHVIRGVIDFAGMIPGFQLLTQDDKFTLLKAGLFDALFVRLICMFDSSINSIICLNGQVMRRDAIQNGANARFLVDSTFNFAERMNSMQLTDTEIGLFCAIVLITPDRPGLRNVELIEKMYTKLKCCLQQVIMQNRPEQPEFLSELMKTLPDLRTLSTLHTEKLVVFRTEHKELLRQQMWSSMDDDAASKSPGSSSWGCDNSSLEDVAKSPMGSVSSTESGDTLADYHHHHLHNSHAHLNGNGNSHHLSSHPASSAPLLAATLTGTSPLSSSLSSSSSPSSCPITSTAMLRNRANSGSSVEEDLSVGPVAATAHLTQNGLTITPVVRHLPSSNAQQHGAANAQQSQQQPQQRYRKLDSPTDSGIESGNEKQDHKMISSLANCSCSCSSGSSSCSSPRSTVDDHHSINGEPSGAVATNGATPTAAAKKFAVEDMPVLKRVLQAPPLYDTNSLMDEAYKPHKKFRAMRSSSISSGGSGHKEGASSSRVSPAPQSDTSESSSVTAAAASSSTSPSSIIVQPHHHHHHQMHQKTSGQSPAHHNQSQVPLMHHQSQLHMHLTRPQTTNGSPYHQANASSLSSTHSVLAKSLMEEPRMTPEQMKRSDIIQNYIKRETAADFNASLVMNRRGSASSSLSPSPVAPGSSTTSSSAIIAGGGCPFAANAAKLRANSPFANSASVITTTTVTTGGPRRTPTPNGRPMSSSPPMENGHHLNVSQQHRYFQSPHSTSSAASPPVSSSPRLVELQVDIADAQQPLNLSKKSPSPSPIPPASITITARNVASPGASPIASPPPNGSSNASKVLLEV